MVRDSTGLDSVSFNAVNGANTASPELFLKSEGRLLFVAAGGLAGSGPLRISIDLFPRGRRTGSVTIASGWSRSPSQQPASLALRKHLDIRLGKEDPSIRAFVRNDTGGDITVVLQAIST